MAHVHLAWELGNGLGHVARLVPLAVELRRRGHDVSLSVRDLVASRSAWLPLDIDCVQAPVFLHRTVGLPKVAASLAEIALAFGYYDGDILAALHEGWRALLKRTGATLVVGDYAPTAMLAARSLGLRAVSIGASFSVPPHGQPLPSLRQGEALEPGRLEAAEARMLRSANHALRGSGAPPVALACELFRGDRALLCSWPELDCYARTALPEGEQWHGLVSDPGGGVAPHWPPGEGPRAFAYLKSGHAGHADVLRALVARGCRVLCYLPDVGRQPPVADPAIAYAAKPVDLDAAFADAALCVCHAGIGTITRSLLAGVPLLLLPMQGEQWLNARAVERMGAGLALPPIATAQDLSSAVSRLVGDSAMRAPARAFAARHAGLTLERLVASLGDAIEREMPVK